MTTAVRFVTNTTAVRFSGGGLPGNERFLEYLVLFLQSGVNEYASDEDATAAGDSLYIASAEHESAKKGTLIYIKQ